MKYYFTKNKICDFIKILAHDFNRGFKIKNVTKKWLQPFPDTIHYQTHKISKTHHTPLETFYVYDAVFDF